MKNRQRKGDIKPQELKEKWLKEASERGTIHPKPEGKGIVFGSDLDLKFTEKHLTERKSVVKKLSLKE